MTSGSVLALYLVFFGVELIFEYSLTWLNVRTVKAHAGNIPESFRGVFDDEAYSKSVSYTLVKSRFGMIVALISSVVVLSVVVSGLLGVIDNWITGAGLKPGITGILFVAVISTMFHIIGLPASIYSLFTIEKRFGFNTMTVKTFILDEVKGLTLSAVIGIPLLLGLFWFIRAAGPLWWLFAFAAFVAFQLFISIIYPLVIAPLFNKFTPLEEGDLRSKIEELASKLSFASRGIFVMDGSRRSRHSNAYFSGIGRSKRIVLFDTLIEKLKSEEILAVLAHEIGHQKKRHIIQRLVVSFALTLLSFWVIDLLLGSDVLFSAFGFGRSSAHGLLIILSFCSGPFTFMLKPLFTSWSRRHEYQADRFAARSGVGAGHLKAALLTLGKDNLTNLSPHPLYSFFHYSHPTLAERISFLSSLERDSS